jgi:hypothetical protein
MNRIGVEVKMREAGLVPAATVNFSVNNLNVPLTVVFQKRIEVLRVSVQQLHQKGIRYRTFSISHTRCYFLS